MHNYQNNPSEHSLCTPTTNLDPIKPTLCTMHHQSTVSSFQSIYHEIGSRSEPKIGTLWISEYFSREIMYCKYRKLTLNARAEASENIRCQIKCTTSLNIPIYANKVVWIERQLENPLPLLMLSERCTTETSKASNSQSHVKMNDQALELHSCKSSTELCLPQYCTTRVFGKVGIEY